MLNTAFAVGAFTLARVLAPLVHDTVFADGYQLSNIFQALKFHEMELIEGVFSIGLISVTSYGAFVGYGL